MFGSGTLKIVGARKGERFTEPLWLAEEKPKATKYKKILELENLPYEHERLEKLLAALKPICFYNEEKAEDFRNKDKLLSLLCEDCKSLKEYYEEVQNDGELHTDLL